MQQTHFYTVSLFVILMTSCNSTKSVSLKDSSDFSDNLPHSETTRVVDTASIVHIDKEQRLITIRCTCESLHDGYYTTHQNSVDKQNSLIKIYDRTNEYICC